MSDDEISERHVETTTLEISNESHDRVKYKYRIIQATPYLFRAVPCSNVYNIIIMVDALSHWLNSGHVVEMSVGIIIFPLSPLPTTTCRKGSFTLHRAGGGLSHK